MDLGTRDEWIEGDGLYDQAEGSQRGVGMQRHAVGAVMIVVGVLGIALNCYLLWCVRKWNGNPANIPRRTNDHAILGLFCSSVMVIFGILVALF